MSIESNLIQTFLFSKYLRRSFSNNVRFLLFTLVTSIITLIKFWINEPTYFLQSTNRTLGNFRFLSLLKVRLGRYLLLIYFQFSFLQHKKCNFFNLLKFFFVGKFARQICDVCAWHINLFTIFFKLFAWKLRYYIYLYKQIGDKWITNKLFKILKRLQTYGFVEVDPFLICCFFKLCFFFAKSI